MERTKHTEEPLSKQVERKVRKKEVKDEELFAGNMDTMISTGSTLLDLAISGGRVRGGGVPGGILVEVFGPESAGKTVLLCEIAGAIQRSGGKVMFHDPEARLNKQFATLFGLDSSDIEYTIPNTIPEVFSKVRDWKVPNVGINGIFADSLAALSTDLEMDNKEGDKMGMRRAKEFSEELRKTCRILQQKNLLMVCSNQIRQNLDAGPYGQKYTTPGGVAIGFYSSLRLRAMKPEKIKAKVMVSGKEVTRVIGVETEFEIYKSSIWKPFRTAPVTIIFDYGIDDVRQNLQFLKTYTGSTTYHLGDSKLGNSLDSAIKTVEQAGIEQDVKEAVINLWEEIESKFETERKPKQR